MAWASIGSRGTANAKTTGADLSFSPSANVVAGRVLILCIAWEIDYTGTPEGASWPSVAVHDSKGNLYTQLGGFSWESYVSIHICTVTTTITTGDTITIHHRNSAHDAKAVTAWEFSRDTSLVWARKHDPVAGGNSGSTSNTIGISDLMQEALIIHATTTRGPSTDTFTYDSDYTPFTKEGTTGGGDETNVTINAQFRITSLASDSATLSYSTSRKTDTLIVAVYETLLVPDFPRFPVLDNFNRADEEPLDFAGAWEPPGYPVTCTPTFGDGYLRVVSNQAGRAVGTAGGASQWWTEPMCGCYAECYASMPVKGQASVYMDGGGCGVDATLTAFSGHWMPVSAGYFPDDQFTNGYAGNTGFIAGNPLRTWVDQADGYKFGLQRDSRSGLDFRHAWIDRGSGWEWVSCWNETTFGPDEECRFGMGTWGDANTRLDDFGAEASPCPQYWVATNTRSARRNYRMLRGV